MRLVDRLPPEHEVAERLADPVDVAGPVVGTGPLVEEAAQVVAEPARQREVVQARPDADAGVARRAQHGRVVLDRVGVVACPARARGAPSRATGGGG